MGLKNNPIGACAQRSQASPCRIKIFNPGGNRELLTSKSDLSEEMKAWLAGAGQRANNRTLQGQVVQLFQEKMQAGQLKLSND